MNNLISRIRYSQSNALHPNDVNMVAAIETLHPDQVNPKAPDQVNTEAPNEAKLELKVVGQDPREAVATVGLTQSLNTQ